MTSTNGNNFGVTGLCVGNSLVTGEFPSQRPMIRSLDVFFDLHLNKWLSKPSNRRWFKVALCSLWHHWMCWLTVVYRGIYASKNWVIIGSGCGLWPVSCHAITWPNADLLSIGLMGTNSKIWIKILLSFDLVLFVLLTLSMVELNIDKTLHIKSTNGKSSSTNILWHCLLKLISGTMRTEWIFCVTKHTVRSCHTRCPLSSLL